MNKQFRIEPSERNPEPLPPVGGLWSRDEDGGLRPVGRATAEAAGLYWPEVVTEPDAVADASADTRKRAR